MPLAPLTLNAFEQPCLLDRLGHNAMLKALPRSISLNRSWLKSNSATVVGEPRNSASESLKERQTGDR
ncbi:hypothetical protein [Stenomitos frigidus]|uniref:Uncharacterized protein n=1 Tax=Stenomitos frigidus ULC18 TaxID=2107698 RepID=A0A2T1EA27_9CYAN|nr:hypothetical protein [Stenomitos frigidus]PSB29564.1 hypothetical protein C7B82_11115 [Stenomitos frigidus ULC18]